MGVWSGVGLVYGGYGFMEATNLRFGDVNGPVTIVNLAGESDARNLTVGLALASLVLPALWFLSLALLVPSAALGCLDMHRRRRRPGRSLTFVTMLVAAVTGQFWAQRWGNRSYPESGDYAAWQTGYAALAVVAVIVMIATVVILRPSNGSPAESTG
ncbi:MAG TPA: hypothetical protein VNU19_06985 [Candidatus Acidoferrum sp.]|nr:hypothetical protein [Candidatus Acidoferrum sp.]